MTKDEFLQRAILTLLSNSDFTQMARNSNYSEESHAIKCAEDLVSYFDDNYYIKDDKFAEETEEERFLRIAKALEEIAKQIKCLTETIDKRLQNINSSICL